MREIPISRRHRASTSVERHFQRIVDFKGSGTRIDIGAYERQTTTAAPTVLTVDTLDDRVDGDYSTGHLSIREAIGISNTSLGVTDTIKFGPSLNGATIDLSEGQLTIIDGVSVDASGLASGVTLDVGILDPVPYLFSLGDGSRVLLIDDGDPGALSGVDLRKLTLRGGDTDGSGGGIYNSEALSLTNVVVSASFAVESGGGIYSDGPLTMTSSTVEGNTSARGGGISLGPTAVSTTLIERSTIRDNLAYDTTLFGVAYGGGLYHTAVGALIIRDSTVLNNQAVGGGGGIYAAGGLLTVLNSTIAKNRATFSGDGTGGGIDLFVSQQASIYHSTIVENNGAGGGVYLSSSTTALLLHGSIVALNTRSSGSPDQISGGGQLTAQFNVIGLGPNNGIANGVDGNKVGVDPLLGPLANNGGPTLTNALLTGSPAIDAGNPAFDPNIFSPPLANDQRGAPFARAFDGDGAGGARIDIGAFELQPIGPALPGDYNLNGVHQPRLSGGVGGVWTAVVVTVRRDDCRAATGHRGVVVALQIIGNTLYIGGSFANGAGILAADFLLACDLTTRTPSATVLSDGGFNGGIAALTADSDGRLYAGGGFLNADSILLADHVAWYKGGTWHAMDAGVTGLVRSLGSRGTDVYVGTDSVDIGGFAKGRPRGPLGRLGVARNGLEHRRQRRLVHRLCLHLRDHDRGVGGLRRGVVPERQRYRDGRRHRLLRWNAWHPLGSNGAGNGPLNADVSALEYFQLKLYAGGGFTNVGGDNLSDALASYWLLRPDAELVRRTTARSPATTSTVRPALARRRPSR